MPTPTTTLLPKLRNLLRDVAIKLAKYACASAILQHSPRSSISLNSAASAFADMSLARSVRNAFLAATRPGLAGITAAGCVVHKALGQHRRIVRGERRSCDVDRPNRMAAAATGGLDTGERRADGCAIALQFTPPAAQRLPW
jgi:hypothetical protein